VEKLINSVACRGGAEGVTAPGIQLSNCINRNFGENDFKKTSEFSAVLQDK